MVYFCVDLEASGPVAPLYNLLSIGVTVVRSVGERHVIGDSYYVELKPVFEGFEPEALAVCGLDVDRLRREGREPGEALRELAAWVAEQNGNDPDGPVFVGHNAVFDWSYIAYYYAHFKMANPFGYKGIDSKSLAMGRLGIPWSDTSKERLQGLLGLAPQQQDKIHRADYDAWYQALILQALLDRAPSASS